MRYRQTGATRPQPGRCNPIGAAAAIFALLAFVTIGCVSTATTHVMSPKVGLDLGDVNAEGLRGPPDGLRAVHYEFCIPADDNLLRKVRAIDPTSEAMKGSRGRIGCTKEQVLVLGNTHQRGFRQVLNRLAGLPYVQRIEENFFE